MDIPYYLKISRASDLPDKKERIFYRALEIFPGALSWLTLSAVFFLSYFKPAWFAVFIIFFIIYWFFRVVYFSVILSVCYQRMRKNEKIDWLEKLKKLKQTKEVNWQNIYQLVVFPVYKESYKVVRDSFQSLIESDWPKERMFVVLSYEERGGEEAKKTAETIKKEFKEKFFKLLITCHPSGLPGELAVKAANDTWAAKKAKQLIIDPLKIPYQDIIVSSFDVDTRVFPKYFTCLAYHYLTVENPTQASYQPIPLFFNNILESSFISRIFAFSASFWQMMCQERPEKLITFSSSSISFKALNEIGFKLVNVVSEDSRIFWQCFLKYNGNYRVIPLYYPVSMDANCAPTFLRTIKNIYKQQRRWAWGAENIPYFLFGFFKNKKIPFFKKFFLSFEIIEGCWSWATASIIIFLSGWLLIFLGGREFQQTLFSYNLPVLIGNILTISMTGLILSAYLSILLLSLRTPVFGKSNLGKARILFFCLEWFFIIFTAIFLGSLPALDAQTRLMLGKYMGFWSTEKSRK